MRKIESGISGSRPRVLVEHEGCEQEAGGGELTDRLSCAPAALGRLDQRVDEQEHPARDEDGAAHVEARGAAPRGRSPLSSRNAPTRISAQNGRLTNSTQRHPGPSDSTPPKKTPAAAPRAADRAPDPERLVPVDALLEQGGDERERRRRHQRGAEALREPGSDQRRSRFGRVRRRGSSRQKRRTPATSTRRRPSRSAARPPRAGSRRR